MKLTRDQLDAWYDAVSRRIDGMLAKRKAELRPAKERYAATVEQQRKNKIMRQKASAGRGL